MSDVIQTERPRPGILLMRVNRPEALNAMNAERTEALHAVLAEVRHGSEVRAIVLTGNGRAFCAGFDLRRRVCVDGLGVRHVPGSSAFIWPGALIGLHRRCRPRWWRTSRSSGPSTRIVRMS